MRILLICAIMGIVACGQNPSQSPHNKAVVANFSTPTGCIFQSTGAFYFETYYNTFSADIYDCPIYPDLDCTYAISAIDNIQEMTCITPNLASPQSTPGICSYMYSGTRLFLDGTTLGGTSAYNCGTTLGGLSCHYFSHASGRGDLICNDYF